MNIWLVLSDRGRLTFESADAFGAGILGARIFKPFPESASIGWMIRAGRDFPAATKRRLESWKCTLVFCEEKEKLSTRGRLTYEDELGTKSFEYVTPVLSFTPSHIRSTPLLLSRSFHILSTPEELIDHVQSLIELRQAAYVHERPFNIWEPRPSSCIPENQEIFLEAVRMVDIFSPNHIELAQLFGEPSPEIFDSALLERLTSSFISSGVGPFNKGAVLLRAGENGCLVVSTGCSSRWMPSYHAVVGERDLSRVIDPTGAGNTFLGAFAIGYLTTHNLIHAACYGIVAASLALEQIGVPTLEILGPGRELWNGSDVYSRLREYRAQLR